MVWVLGMKKMTQRLIIKMMNLFHQMKKMKCLMKIFFLKKLNNYEDNIDENEINSDRIDYRISGLYGRLLKDNRLFNLKS